MGGNSKGKKSSDHKMADLERRMAQVELEEKRNAALLWWQDIKYEMLKLKEAQQLKLYKLSVSLPISLRSGRSNTDTFNVRSHWRPTTTPTF